MQRWFTPTFHAEQADTLEGIKNMFLRMPLDGFIGTMIAIRDADLRGAAPQTKVPTICIVGEEDGSTPPALVVETAKMIPDSRYEVIKNAGHIPCVEQPEILVEIIKAFFADAGIK